MSLVVNQVVPERYKQTEVGIIPSDWKISKLGNIGKFKNGINKGAGSFGHGLPFINLMDVFGKSYISGDEKFGLIDSNEVERKEYNIKVSDVLFIRSSVKPSGVGLTSVALQDVKNAVYSGFLIRYRSNGELGTGFKKHCFYDSGFRGRLIAASTVSANTNINQEALKELQIVYPSNTEEQTAIANALSDIDTLLSELEKLIAKKQAIKTAAMQQLLTGKTRLPQFATYAEGDKKGQVKGSKSSELGEIPEDWEVKALSSMLNGAPSYGINAAAVPLVGNLPVYIRITDISEDGYFKPSNKVGVNSSLSDLYKLERGDLVLARTGASVGKSYLYRESDGVLVFAGFLIRVSPNEKKLISAYLSHYLKTDKYWAWVTVNSMRSGQPGINGNEFGSLSLPVPNTEEQTAIATILSNMDEEIQALQQRLSKTRQIKQGMMQELLTGKTRLIQGEAHD